MTVNQVIFSRDKYLGVEFNTNKSGKCFIIDYKGNKDVTVMFYEPLYVTKCQLVHLKAGRVVNPLKRTVHNVGYLGIGGFKSYAHSKAYSTWFKMLTRCYCVEMWDFHPTYKDVTVCEEWLNFQNFAKWYYDHPFHDSKDEKGKSYQLDKDLTVSGSRTYSPKTCSFVPQRLNSLLSSCQKVRGELPIGVTKCSKSSKYIAQLNRADVGWKKLGRYSTPVEAFKAYKEVKELYIKASAEKWRGRIDEKVYEFLINYEINIDD